MSVVRAGIVVTGTEVLAGIIRDANGPWLSERLRGLGVELAHVMVVGDRRSDLLAALRFLSSCDLVITSGGLGPTADDMTAEVVAEFAGVPLELDPGLEERIWGIISALRGRWRDVSDESLRAGNRKQALVPRGRFGAGAGRHGARAGGAGRGRSRAWWCCRGRRASCSRCGRRRLRVPAVRDVLARAGVLEQRIMRITGVPESQLAEVLREVDPPDALEITTCLRRGELEIATVFDPSASSDYAALEAAVLDRFGARVFSRDGSTIDDIVASLLLGPPVRTVAVAESCTGGLMAARLTDRAGSSAYVLGGVTAYSNEAKVEHVGVPASLIERHGAVSPEVARALAAGAAERFGAALGIGITGDRRSRRRHARQARRNGLRVRGGRWRRGPDRARGAPAGRPSGRPRPHDDSRDAPAPPGASRGAPGVIDRGMTASDPDLRPVRPARPRGASGPTRLVRPRRPAAPLRRPRAPGGRPAALVAFRDAAADPEVWRPVADEALHLTLAFLGRRPAGDVTIVSSVLNEAAGPAPRLSLAGGLLLPPRRARVLCASLADPDGTLAELQSRVSDGLAEARVYVPEKRPFRAHATVARLRPRARAPRTIDEAPEPLEFAGGPLTLFESRLHPQGARYEPLTRVSLH